MTRLEALKKLSAKVDAGELSYPQAQAWGHHGTGNSGLTWSAYLGSFDAAKALHEAVLPGWGWIATNKGEWAGQPDGPIVSVTRDDDISSFEASCSDPARAWLLAILRALIAQEEGT